MPTTIVIADDHAVFRGALKVFLEQESDFLVVGEAGTGREALAAIEDNDPDVLLLDISMPGLSGARVAQEALRRKPALAIVVLTMHDEKYYAQDLFRFGARAFVLKKSSGEELLRAIRAAHKGERYVDPALVDEAVASYVGIASRAGASAELELDVLTPREQEICRLLAYGHTNVEIAEQLYISNRTVQTHRRNILTKLGLSGRAELVAFAIDHGLFNPY